MKTYSKGELAALYMPDSAIEVARKHLCAWIKHNEALQEELKAAGYSPSAKLLTPKQVQIIFKYVGEP